MSWKEALVQEGSNYVGYVSKAFEGFDFTDMERRWDLTDSNKPLLAREGLFYVSYLDKGGEITIKNMVSGLPFYWFNPESGEFEAEGITSADGFFKAPDINPWVLLIGERVFNQ